MLTVFSVAYVAGSATVMAAATTLNTVQSYAPTKESLTSSILPADMSPSLYIPSLPHTEVNLSPTLDSTSSPLEVDLHISNDTLPAKTDRILYKPRCPTDAIKANFTLPNFSANIENTLLSRYLILG